MTELSLCAPALSESWSVGNRWAFQIRVQFILLPQNIASHERQLYEYTQWREIEEFAQKHLDTDAEGWIPPESDWAKKRSQ